MKNRISAIMLLSLMLSMLFMPLVVTADDGKSIIKGMVQAPADYSVGFTKFDYGFLHLYGRYHLGGYLDAYDRVWVYWPLEWVFWRLPPE